MSSTLLLDSSCLIGILYTIFRGMFGCFMNKYQYSGISIGNFSGVQYLLKNVDSKDTMFINLDEEVMKFVDDKKTTSFSSSLEFYKKSREIYNDICEIADNTSKSIRKICFISKDYKLLKFLGIKSILYTLGTKDFYDKLNLEQKAKDEVQSYREMLLNNKKNKLEAYGSLDGLMDIICKAYNCHPKM